MTATKQSETLLWEDQEFLSSEEIRRRVYKLGPLITAEADAANDEGKLTDALKEALRD